MLDNRTLSHSLIHIYLNRVFSCLPAWYLFVVSLPLNLFLRLRIYALLKSLWLAFKGLNYYSVEVENIKKILKYQQKFLSKFVALVTAILLLLWWYSTDWTDSVGLAQISKQWTFHLLILSMRYGELELKILNNKLIEVYFVHFVPTGAFIHWRLVSSFYAIFSSHFPHNTIIVYCNNAMNFKILKMESWSYLWKPMIATGFVLGT